MTSLTERAKGKLAALSSSFDELEQLLEPLFAQTLPETVVGLELMQQAKLQTVLPYVVYDLIFIYLKLRGIDPKTHPVVQELERVKQYFNKISNAENPPQKRTEIDKGAAQRFIKHAITQATYAAAKSSSGEESPGPSTTPSAQIQAKITSKMLERQLYEKKLKEQDARDSEEEELEVFDEDASMDVEPEKKSKGKAKEVPPPDNETRLKGNKRRRPAIDPFAGDLRRSKVDGLFIELNSVSGYGDDTPAATPTSESPGRLFHSICIKHRHTVPRLYRRIRAGLAGNDGEASAGTFDASPLVYHLSVETWDVDADVLIGLLGLLPNLRTLNVWIGPSNFTPEHLDEMLKAPMPSLEYLSIRFRPYVKKATYYQFLKGSYFDSSLLAWPQGLPALSIVQDSFTQDTATRFAQPIVFFRLDLHLSLLVHSRPDLTSLRVRIPSRAVVHPLTVPYSSPSTTVVPPLHFLDIATSTASESDIEKLLIHFTTLHHLVLDACASLLRSASPQALGTELDWWFALGRRLAMAGVKRAREREKLLVKEWEANHAHAAGGGEDGDEPSEGSGPREKKSKRGRRGLATATITLRGADAPEPLPRAGARSSSSAPSTSASTSTSRSALGAQTRPLAPPKFHIVPPLPILRSISLSPTPVESLIPPAVRPLIAAEFERGWNDGVRVVWEIRTRLGTTFVRYHQQRNSKGIIKFLAFKDKGRNIDEDEDEDWEEYEGMEDVLVGQEDIYFFRNEETHLNVGTPPILCLAGPDIAAHGHVPGCPHTVGRELGLESVEG
ncbi:hypothetical protein H0H92_004472 [Tricholoma furcatifolium]|nr:hypothetical protein H0H92_004472 [Tricholoma furcatifolium]